VAAHADVAVVFAGLPDSYESEAASLPRSTLSAAETAEGFDRSSLEMPSGHNQLIEAVSSVQPKIIFALMNGSAITMPWADRVKAIVEGWLGGQAGGGAIADVITGRINPSGKLSETFPKRLQDTPTFPDFPALDRRASYGEGVFIGYRYYDKKDVEPLFPFGFGLSYTTFVYTGMKASAPSINTDGVTIEVAVKNTGNVPGKEVIQLYLHEQNPAVSRSKKELKAFDKIALAPGEEKVVAFKLSKRDFAYYDTDLHYWNVRSGKFCVLVGCSSRDLPLKETIEVQTTTQIIYPKPSTSPMILPCLP
jgi:beta-glucosidase